jgi:hypothetical protein
MGQFHAKILGQIPKPIGVFLQCQTTSQFLQVYRFVRAFQTPVSWGIYATFFHTGQVV